jgi:hypothetical protein
MVKKSGRKPSSIKVRLMCELVIAIVVLMIPLAMATRFVLAFLLSLCVGILLLLLTWAVILLFYRQLTVDTPVSPIYAQSETTLLPLRDPANREAIKGLVALAILSVGVGSGYSI